MKNNEQLKLLQKYQIEYQNKLYNQKLIGITVYDWDNYNKFLIILNSIIRNHIDEIYKNKKKIKDSIHVLLKNQIRLKTWKYLSLKKRKMILRSKKLMDQRQIDDDMYLKLLK